MTPIYDLTEWAAAQASPWVPHNAALRAIEAADRGSVLDRDLAAPPGACDDGAAYLIAAAPTGAWAGKAGLLAVAVGVNAANGWIFVRVATEGKILWVEDEATRIQFTGGAWGTFPDVGSLFQTVVTASEAIAPGELLNVFDSAGDPRVRLADATDPAKFCNAFALSAAAAPGDPCTVMSTGINKEVSPAQSGEVWLSETTPGGFEFAAPAGAGEIVQPVGTAIEGVGVLFVPGPRIEL